MADDAETPPFEYLIVCTGGLEEVTCREAEGALRLVGAPQVLSRGTSDGHAGFGKVRVVTTSHPRRVRSLRSAHSLLAFAGHTSFLRTERAEGLADARRAIEAARWADALAVWRAHRRLLQPRVPEHPPFRASALRDGGHAFTSPELSRLLGECLGCALQLPVDLVGFELEALAVAHDEHLTLGISLAFERTWRGGCMMADVRPLMPYVERTYNLRPSAACALAQLCAPRVGDVVVDCMAGIGTVPIELFGQWPSLLCLGGDSSGRALLCAAPNARYARAVLTERARPEGPSGWAGERRAQAEAGRPLPAARGRRGTVECLHWDATALPLRPGCADLAVVDLPFGERCGSKDELGDLYARALRQLALALRVGGRAVLLTLEGEELSRALCAQQPLWRVSARCEAVTIGSYPRCLVLALERSDLAVPQPPPGGGAESGPLSRQGRAAAERLARRAAARLSQTPSSD